jgi:surface glycoprotein (TIGR04207 family)
MSSDRREKGRAIFLAAIMVLSVVGMTMAFAGSAAAQEASQPGSGEVVLLNETGDQVDTYDSGTPLQSAYDNASEDYTIIVGSGTFTVPDPQIDGLTIEGAGMDETTLETNQMNPDATNLTISNLEIDSDGAAILIRDDMAANGLHIENVRVTSSDGTTTIAFQTVAKEDNVDKADGLHIENFVADNPSVKGLYLERANNATLSDITVDGVQYTGNENPPSNGIDINLKYDEYKNLTIEDTVVRGVEADDFDPDPTWNAAMAIKARDDGSYSSPAATLTDVTIDNVTVEESVAGLRFGEPGVDYSSSPEGPTDVTITDSTFQNNENYHIEDLSGSVDLEMDEDENTFDQSVVFKDRIHPSIQAAVDYADSGDTISVGPGTYEESIVIDGTNNLTLQGVEDASGNSPVIVGGGANVGSQPHAAIQVDGNGPTQETTIEGFTIRNPDGHYGVYTGTGGSDSDVDGFVLRNNTIEDIATNISSHNPLAGSVSGLYVRAQYDSITVEDNTIRNVNTKGDNSQNAVGLSFSSFIGDEAFADTDPGSETAENTSVQNNVVTNITGAEGSRTKGISVSGEFDGLTIANNTVTAVSANITDSNILAITLTENPGKSGSDIDGDGTNERIGPRNFEIRDNDIDELSGADEALVSVGGYEDLGDNHVVEDNNFLDTDAGVSRFAQNQGGFNPGDEDTLDATSNWWGAADGPSGGVEDPTTGAVANGDGAAVNGEVAFTPWLDAPFDAGGENVQASGGSGTTENTDTATVSTDGASGVSETSVTFDGDSGVTSVSVSARAPSDNEGLPTTQVATVVDITPSGEGVDTDNLPATIELTLPASRLDALGVTADELASPAAAEDVTVLRETNSGFETLELTSDNVVADGSDAIVTVETTGFSEFVVGIETGLGSSTFEITDINTPAEVAADGTVDVQYTVENVGDEPARQSTGLAIDGQNVASKPDTLTAGQSVTNSFSDVTLPAGVNAGETVEITVQTNDDAVTTELNVTADGSNGGDGADGGDGTPADPPAEYAPIGDPGVNNSGVIEAIQDWQNDELDNTAIVEIVQAWQSN